VNCGLSSDDLAGAAHPTTIVGPDLYNPTVDPRTVVIVNPKSQGGRLGKRWPEIAEVLGRAFPYDDVHTTGPNDATRIAREALESGADRIIAIGGDGTINEVVNGFFDGAGKPIKPDAALGIMPFGTGGDFRRTLGIPTDPHEATEILKANRTKAIDVGKLELTGHDGKPALRMFANIASFGVSGHLDRMINESGKKLGRFGYFVLGTKATITYKNQRVQLIFDGNVNDRVEVTAYNVAVANGRFFGGGMKIAPNAELDDGVFDITVVGDLGLVQLLKGFARQVYTGDHLKTKGVSVRRARVVEAEAIDPNDPVEFDVDGEHLGRLPARFEVVPHALKVIVAIPEGAGAGRGASAGHG
jgi:YegS/Rv2252/BmrU family lipid kinase